jgi:hypothetical protein
MRLPILKHTFKLCKENLLHMNFETRFKIFEKYISGQREGLDKVQSRSASLQRKR